VNVGRADGNLALNKQADQKGGNAAEAKMAVDGNIATSWCTEVSNTDDPWWRVDLGDKYTVGKVVISFPADNTKGSYIHILFQQSRANKISTYKNNKRTLVLWLNKGNNAS